MVIQGILLHIGVAIVIIGFVFEALGVLGATFYPVRQVLPVKSPLVLISPAYTMYFLGGLITLASQTLF